MKNTHLIPLAIATLTLPLSAETVVYEGTWKNNTFDTSGPLRIEVDQTATSTTITIDLDGPVFGQGDPPPFSFDVPIDEDGEGEFSVSGTQIGDVRGSIEGDGEVDIDITNIPGGFLSDVEMDGTFDFEGRQFEGTYEIFTDLGSFAEGELEASAPLPPVDPKPPVIKASKKGSFTGKKATVRARVSSDSAITEFGADVTKGKAKARVRGSGPYRIRIKRIRSKRLVLTLSATNEDQLTATRTVKLRRSRGRIEASR